MALTTGPLLSLGASGSVAGTMTFSKWKGRPYVRQLVTPANPKTPGQTTTRAMMAFLSKAWAIMPAQIQADWQALATQKSISPFNAMVGFNMALWTQWKYPQSYPQFQTLTGDVMGAATYTGGVRQIGISHVLTTKNRGWGVAYYVSKAVNPATARQNLRLIINSEGVASAGTLTGTITGLEPGTYYLGYVAFGETGTPGSAVEDATGIVVT